MPGSLRSARPAIQQNTLSFSTGRLNGKQDVNFGKKKQQDKVYCDVTKIYRVRRSFLGAFI
jgi:hypothetical protein